MERDIKLDLLRVASIFLVIIIHVSNIYCLNYPKISNEYYLISLIFNAVSRVCVPIFFMISGALLINRKYDRKKYISRIIKFVLILIIWSLIYYLIKNSNQNIINAFLTSLFEASKTQRHLWFMYAIIGIYIILPFIQNMFKNLNKELENLFIILFVVLNGLSSLLVPFSQSILDNNIDLTYPIPIIQGTYYLGYFIIGYIIYKRIKEKQINIDKYKLYLIFTSLISSLLIIFITYFKTMNLNYHYETMLWYKNIFTMISSMCIFSLFINMKTNFKNNNIFILSNLSFGIYLIHMIFLNIMKDHITIINYNPLIFIPIFTIIIYLFSFINCIIISKIPYFKKIIGLD